MTLSAIILAGGLGTRLRSVVPDRPKPMAPIAGRPFLEYLLDYWISQGVGHFILSLGYKHESIVSHLGPSYKGASLDYAIELSPMGTGGGLLLAAQKVKPGASFLLLNGDTYFAVDLQRLIHFAQEKEADWCFALFSAPSLDRYMAMDVSSEGRIHSFTASKAQQICLVNGGVYWIHHQAFMESQIDLGEKFSLEQDLLPKALLAKQRLFGLVFHDTFIDIGIPEDYHRSKSLLTPRNEYDKSHQFT